ncbi:hypothetical protein [Terrabacter sp. 2RAF25]|uniref:hypothetical protein n=1 Tax=Terrabacter sp. 2RAF25 TaxID=3232998 RepID=UPI003F970C07
MADKEILKDWVLEALESLGGSGSVLAVSKKIWARHEDDIVSSGDLFYTWQYDVRWAAQKLRDSGRLKPSPGRSARANWELSP